MIVRRNIAPFGRGVRGHYVRMPHTDCKIVCGESFIKPRGAPPTNGFFFICVEKRTGTLFVANAPRYEITATSLFNPNCARTATNTRANLASPTPPGVHHGSLGQVGDGDAIALKVCVSGRRCFAAATENGARRTMSWQSRFITSD